MQRWDLVIFCVFWLSFNCDSYICQPIDLFNASWGFQKYQDRFNQKIYSGKNLAVAVVYFCNGHSSVKRGRIFHWLNYTELYLWL